jgi:hypothetical protein
MEFTYRISEEEYLRATKLKLKEALRLGRIGKFIMFWVVILAGLMVTISFVQKYRNQSPTQQEIVESVPTETPTSQIIENVVPVIVIFGIMAFVIFRGVPMQVRRMYRKNPMMQGQFTINITPESISTQNTAGTLSKTGWNIYDYWREGKNLILLVYHSGAYFLISLAGLSDAQRDELRGILAAALPKK